MNWTAGILDRAIHRGNVYEDAPRSVYWEMTVACDLACRHCRASGLLRDVRKMRSMIILTGGDPA